MLKRKREEIVQRWEEREARLKRLRSREKLEEKRGSKRRRIDHPSAKSGPSSKDAEDEWLLNDPGDEELQADGEASSFSKETRSLMEKLGMGLPMRGDEEDDRNDERIKVNNPYPITHVLLTATDLLHITDSFAVDTVHSRTQKTGIPSIGTGGPAVCRWQVRR